MKLIILLSRVPYPTEKGDKLRAFHQIRTLAKNHEITLIALSDQKIHPKSIEILQEYCHKIHVFKLSKPGLLFNIIKVLFNGKPFQVGYFFRSGILKKIQKIVSDTNPDHIFCQLIRMAEYARLLPQQKTLDYQDVFSMGMKRRLSNSPLFMKPLYFWEYKRLLKYENSVFNDFNHKTIISEPDRELIPHKDKNQIVVIPNGVDSEYFKPRQSNKKYDVVFTGNMGYPPNVDAAEYLAKEIIPLLRQRIPLVSLLLAGANPHPKVKALAAENITVSGWVPDIRESYASSRVFIAPMRIGTGLQNKLLEAMSMQIPCITSPLANNALGATENKEILVGSATEEFAEHLYQLLTNLTLAHSIALNGQQYILKNYNWDSSTSALEKLFILK